MSAEPVTETTESTGREDEAEERLIPRAHTLGITAFGFEWGGIKVGLTQNELWKRLHAQWDAVQRAANAALRAWLIEDVAEIEIDEKGKRRLPKVPVEAGRCAYADARHVAPELTSGCVADICQRVRARYLKDRWSVRVAGRQSGASFDRPLPLSIRRQDWQLVSLGDDEKGRTMYGARFALGELKRDMRPVVRFVVRTPGDAKVLQRLAAGDWKRRTLEIVVPGWQRKGPLKAKVVYARPRPERSKSAEGVLRVRTAADGLLIAAVGQGESATLYRWNYDWLRERIIAYERRRQRHAEDCKHERRVPSGRRRVWREDYGRAAEKQQRRVRTAIMNISRQVIGLAERRGCGLVVYDDRERGWCSPFPWAMLRSTLVQCGEGRGVEVEVPDGDGEGDEGSGADRIAAPGIE